MIMLTTPKAAVAARTQRQEQRRELMSDWLATRTAEALRRREVDKKSRLPVKVKRAK